MRRPWLTLLFNVSVFAIALGQPNNDSCENAIPIPLGPVAGCSSAEGARAGIDGTNRDAAPSTPVIRLADDFGNGPGLDASSADVWYELIPSGNRLLISLAGSLETPVLVLFQAVDCSEKLPLGWSKGAPGTGAATLESSVEPGQRYLLMAGGQGLADQGDFTLAISTFNDCGACARRRGILSAEPPPINGAYQAGQAVQFCYRVAFWDPGVSLEWLHGVEVAFGPGWDLSSLQTTAPEACTAPDGGWQWYDSWQSCNTGEVFGPGFAFDARYGLLCPGAAISDGDPGNNFGDGPCGAVDAGPLPLEFCWTIRVKESFASPEEANLNLEIALLGDGYSGSWMQYSCNDEPATTFYATAIPDASLLPDISILRAPCATACDGLATISGNPAGDWHYKITDEDGNIILDMPAQPGVDSIANLCPGAYLFEVSNPSGAIRQVARIEVPAGLSPEAQAGYLPACVPGERIQLVAGVNITGMPVSYSWAGPGGFSSTLASPYTDVPGEYFLEVEVGGCRAPTASIRAESGMPEINCEATPSSILFSWERNPQDTAYIVDVLSGHTGNWRSVNSFEVTGLAPGEEARIELTKMGTGSCGIAIAEARCEALSCPLPLVTPDTTICRGQSLRLWVNIPPNTTTVWSPAAGLSCTNCIAPMASPDTTTTYRVDITYADGCTASRQATIYVSSLPESILPNEYMPYCLGRPLEICLPEGNDYLWISPVGFITTGNCINFPVTTELLTGRHTIRVRLPGGCQFYDYLYLYPKHCDSQQGPQIGLTPPPPFSLGGETKARAFPNPARSLLRVEIPCAGPKVLQLFRMDGQRVFLMETEEQAAEISTAQFPAGAYWLAVGSREGQERMKVVVVE